MNNFPLITHIGDPKNVPPFSRSISHNLKIICKATIYGSERLLAKAPHMIIGSSVDIIDYLIHLKMEDFISEKNHLQRTILHNFIYNKIAAKSFRL